MVDENEFKGDAPKNDDSVDDQLSSEVDNLTQGGLDMSSEAEVIAEPMADVPAVAEESDIFAAPQVADLFGTRKAEEPLEVDAEPVPLGMSSEAEVIAEPMADAPAVTEEADIFAAPQVADLFGTQKAEEPLEGDAEPVSPDMLSEAEVIVEPIADTPDGQTDFDAVVISTATESDSPKKPKVMVETIVVEDEISPAGGAEALDKDVPVIVAEEATSEKSEEEPVVDDRFPEDVVASAEGAESVEPVDEQPVAKSSIARPVQEKPAWKIEAERIYEERQAKHRRMIEERRELDEERFQEQREQQRTLQAKKAAMDERLRQRWTRQEREQQANFDAMMQRVRDEKERKRQEREAVDAQLRRERAEKSYQSDRNEETQPRQELPTSNHEVVPNPTPQPRPTPKPTNRGGDDLESRLSRLSKKEKDDDK